MHLYKVEWQDAREGSQLVWCGSMAAAKQEAREQRDGPRYAELERDERPKFEIEAVEIPTDKAGLLEWLNANVKQHNHH